MDTAELDLDRLEDEAACADATDSLAAIPAESLRALIAAARREDELEQVMADAYQAVGVLGHAFGLGDNPEYVRLLDVLAYGRTEDGVPLLPFSATAEELAPNALNAARERIAELEEGLRPFAGLGEAVISPPFGDVIFPDDQTAFADDEDEGCVAHVNGDLRRITWGNFRRAARLLSPAQKAE